MESLVLVPKLIDQFMKMIADMQNQPISLLDAVTCRIHFGRDALALVQMVDDTNTGIEVDRYLPI